VAFATLNQPPRLRAILETLMRADTPPWLRRGVRLPIFASRYHVCPPVSASRDENSADLTVCAELVQDQAGELYGWHLHGSSFTTIFMDLPV